MRPVVVTDLFCRVCRVIINPIYWIVNPIWDHKLLFNDERFRRRSSLRGCTAMHAALHSAIATVDQEHLMVIPSAKDIILESILTRPVALSKCLSHAKMPQRARSGALLNRHDASFSISLEFTPYLPMNVFRDSSRTASTFERQRSIQQHK